MAERPLATVVYFSTALIAMGFMPVQDDKKKRRAVIQQHLKK